MNILKWVAALLLGPSSGPAGGVVESVATAVDKAIYTEQEKAADDRDDTQSARQFSPAPLAGEQS